MIPVLYASQMCDKLDNNDFVNFQVIYKPLNIINASMTLKFLLQPGTISKSPTTVSSASAAGVGTGYETWGASTCREMPRGAGAEVCGRLSPLSPVVGPGRSWPAGLLKGTWLRCGRQDTLEHQYLCCASHFTQPEQPSESNGCCSLPGLRHAQIAGKTLLLSVSGRMFLEEISI